MVREAARRKRQHAEVPEGSEAGSWGTQNSVPGLSDSYQVSLMVTFSSAFLKVSLPGLWGRARPARWGSTSKPGTLGLLKHTTRSRVIQTSPGKTEMWIEMCSGRDWACIPAVLEVCTLATELGRQNWEQNERKMLWWLGLWFTNAGVTSTWGLQSRPERQTLLLALGGKKGLWSVYKGVSVFIVMCFNDSH